jgi:transposase
MIQITAQMRVLVAIEPVDGRKGIDSLARLCQDKLAEDPFSGCVFVFRSRSGTAIRLLSYDGQGYWLAQKRLSKGRFVWWPEWDKPAKPLEAGERAEVNIFERKQSCPLAFQKRQIHTVVDGGVQLSRAEDRSRRHSIYTQADCCAS